MSVVIWPNILYGSKTVKTILCNLYYFISTELILYQFLHYYGVLALWSVWRWCVLLASRLGTENNHTGSLSEIAKMASTCLLNSHYWSFTPHIQNFFGYNLHSYTSKILCELTSITLYNIQLQKHFSSYSLYLSLIHI